jgi:branched-chain amino acid transport system permease protein
MFVKAGNARLEYYQHGNGQDAVLLVHGYASSARLWRLAMVEMDPRRFRVIALNNRGAGDSDRSPKEAGYTVENFAQDLHHAVAALGLEGFTLVGHSMGGATVAQYALAHQDRLKALVLLNSAPLIGRPLAQGWDATIREQFRTGERPQGDMGFNAPHVTESFKQAVLADIARNPLERAIGGRRSMSQLRLRERLRELRAPTLVVGGDRDTTVGVDNILADYLALPEDVRSLHIFHGIGHSPNVEVPEAFAGLLGRFIEEVNERRGVSVIGQQVR